MRKNITVEDVVKSRADLTDVRFMIVLAMLQEDGELMRRVKAYIEQVQFTVSQAARSTK